ncbi:nucleoid-associated protein [Acidovorax soli]|uniref:Nucleoid-associated protein n=1 Tax=Acidovorax soli TaxID=592050 RepID=A0A7X0PBJ6_9BURK|nr:nucleoid-associated protein [Acidovorax soli]MBB6558863.1 nucleoid-associated protein [Acidovorax soli]
MAITAAVLHKLIKEPHGPTTVQTRDEALPLNEPVQNLINAISKFYGSRANKGYGRFEEDVLTYPTSTVLRRMFVVSDLNFVDGSKQLLDVLAGKARQAPLSKGGYVLMAHGDSDAGNAWFLVAIINNVPSNAVNEVTLEIEESVHVDVDNLRVAGRVNLTNWLEGSEQDRYLGFLKHRGDVADYFKYFLGCNVVVRDAEDTKRLVDGLRAFAHAENLDQAQEDDFLRRAHAFCAERSKAREPLSLEELTNAAWPEAPERLAQSLAASAVEISDGFVPDGRSLKSLIKFHGKAKFWTVDLDRRALRSGDAQYVQARGELILRNLPQTLKSALDGEVREGEDDGAGGRND